MNKVHAVAGRAPAVESDTTPDDQALVEQARTSPAAFAVLYDRHLTGVYRYLLAKVGSVEDAEDLTAQTFLEALEQLPRYRGTGVFRAWLFRIARNKSVDHFRRRRPTVALVDDGPWRDDSAESPDDAADRALTLDFVARKLSTLAPDRADALSLRLFAGLEVSEIAQTLNKPEPAVRMLIHRGIRDLQSRLPATLQETTR